MKRSMRTNCKETVSIKVWLVLNSTVFKVQRLQEYVWCGKVILYVIFCYLLLGARVSFTLYFIVPIVKKVHPRSVELPY